MPNTEGVLKIVRKHFPKVTEVRDAEKPLAIEVLPEDGKKAVRRNKNECAMAQACKRAYHADGVILARSVAYLIKGTLAVKFKVPPSVLAEIVSFDRGGGFATGTYQLSKPAKEKRTKRTDLDPQRERKNKDKRKYHRISGIRTVLGSLDDKG